MTVTTHANFIPEIWSKEILDVIHSEYVLADLVWRFDSEVKSGGDTIHVPNVSALTAATKTAGTAVTFQANTETKVDITVGTHQVVPFLLEDITKVQSSYDLMSIYTREAGKRIAAAVDSSIAALHSGFSQGVSAGAALEDSEIITAVEFLDAADAPRSDRAFVIHSEALADMRALDKFTRYDATGQAAVQTGGNNGLIGNVYGVPVYLSNNVEIESGTPDLVHNLMFHKEAMALAMQKEPTTESEYSVDYLGTKVAVHTIYGVAEMRDTFAVDVTIDS